MTIRLFAVLFLLLSGCAFAGQAKPASAPKAPVPPPGVPKDARLVERDIWEAKQPDGTAIRYRMTPFGIMRLLPKREDANPEPREGTPGDIGIIAADEGESVRFEKRTPFGPMIWRQKKSQLNETERLAWERSQAAATSTPPAEQNTDGKKEK